MIRSAAQSSLLNDTRYTSMSAGVVPSSEYLIQTAFITENTPSVTFDVSSFAGVYKHLQIVVVARSSHSAANRTSGAIRLNGNSGANYATHLLHGNSSTVSSAAFTSQSFMRNIMFFGALPGSSNTANAFGAAIVEILDPYNTSKNTTVRVLHGSAQTDSRLSLASGVWLNTESLTSIEIAPNEDASWGSSSFIAGSRFSLYGVTA
jgi:hypothetical protein